VFQEPIQKSSKFTSQNEPRDLLKDLGITTTTMNISRKVKKARGIPD
jgi:arginine repressor